MVWRITADQPEAVNFTAQIDSPHALAQTAVREGDQLALFGRVEADGLEFEARMRIGMIRIFVWAHRKITLPIAPVSGLKKIR